MKIILASFIFTILCMGSYAQNDSLKTAAPSSKVYIGYSWFGFSYGIGGYLSNDNQLNLANEDKLFDLNYGKSSSFAFNIYEHIFHLGSEHFRFNTGLGFDFNRYGFKRNVSLDYNADSTWAVLDSTPTYTKNFLKATYLTIPLLFSVSTAKKNLLMFSAGIIGGVRIGSKTKQKYFVGGDKIKEKTKGDYNLSPFKVSLTSILSLGSVRLSGSYDLTRLFLNNYGPELTPFSIKLTYNPMTTIIKVLGK